MFTNYATMKQILQSLRDGQTTIADVPIPSAGKGKLLISTSHTLVSAGTERMLIDFGKAGWIQKARQQPDKVRMVLDKIRTDGLKPTIEAVFSKLDQPLPLGYCNVGKVVELGTGVTNYVEGERVISNGYHAEAVSVPVNLCAKVPDNVSDEEAAFTVLGAVALQGIRLVEPTLGETVVVIGLGLVGLMVVQLLRANGCRVLGVDFDSAKLKLAREFGAEVVDLAASEDPLKAADLYSRGRGVDAVVVTAATQSSEPIHQAATMCRKRGRIVLVGVTGLELSREDFFKKELTFQVSASYGPGRYDPIYEDKGQDYPIGFVRWTEQRNFEAVLDMMSEGKLDVKPLISHRFPIEKAIDAYGKMSGEEPSLGVVLTYPVVQIVDQPRTVPIEKVSSKSGSVNKGKATGRVSVSFIGAGNYATRILIPAFRDAEVHLRSVASSGGISGVYAGRKFGFEETTTDVGSILRDSKTDAVVITTRHNTHAEWVIQALEAGKHVFVEKPLCLTHRDLNQIQTVYEETKKLDMSPPILMVGFNRRFAPHVQKVKSLLYAVSGPKIFNMTVNAGKVPTEHWTQDLEVGGGRIVGEACHFVDLLRFLSDSSIESYKLSEMSSSNRDTAVIVMSFSDGSVGTINYLSNGHSSFPKERLEVFASGSILQLDNFRSLRGYGWPGFKKMRLWSQDKGQKACAKSFVEATMGLASSPIDMDELIEVSRICINLSP